ncbi:MAG: hypothetical protein J7493_13495 [Porphyrobacter sp.]|nr:hypothetical protein [Porphyrobacter sp.]
MALLTAIMALASFVVAMNGFSAGVAAVQFLWPSGRRRGARVLIAVTWAALVAIGWSIPLMPAKIAGGSTPVVYYVMATGFLFAFIMILSLPGALIVSRKLERQSAPIRAFE